MSIVRADELPLCIYWNKRFYFFSKKGEKGFFHARDKVNGIKSLQFD